MLVRSTTQATPLLLALQREILEREAWPALRTSLPGQAEGYWAAARDVHLDSLSPSEREELGRRFKLAAFLDSACADLGFSTEVIALEGADPGSGEPAMQRRWCGTVWPTRPAPSRRASRPRLRSAVERALFLDRDDPIAAWGELHDLQAG